MPDENKVEHLKQIAKLIRYNTLIATTNAGSGHPTSAMSATELMVGLLFGGTFRYDLDHPGHPNNDRLIFSKGHASQTRGSQASGTASRRGRQDGLSSRQRGGHADSLRKRLEADLSEVSRDREP